MPSPPRSGLRNRAEFNVYYVLPQVLDASPTVPGQTSQALSVDKMLSNMPHCNDTPAPAARVMISPC